jgi:MFS transporter, PHS family, inorganic phosphate transporter
VWRIVVGLSLIPAFATLYQRLVLPESTRYLESQKQFTDQEAFQDFKTANNADEKDVTKNETIVSQPGSSNQEPERDEPEVLVKKKAHIRGNSPSYYW